jgi:hypothetical protein
MAEAEDDWRLDFIAYIMEAWSNASQNTRSSVRR